MPENIVNRRRQPHKNPRPQTSCAICHRRKVKCDKQLPCGPCKRHGCDDACRFDGAPATNVLYRLAEDLKPSSSHPARPTTGVQPACQTNDEVLAGIRSPQQDESWFSSGQSPATMQDEAPTANFASNFSGSTSLPTHDWNSDSSHVRGRTHISWSLEPFRPLTRFLAKDGRDPMGTTARDDDARVFERVFNFDIEIFVPRVDFDASLSMENIHDEVPDMTTTCDLVFRYFHTWHLIYPFVDREAFGQDFSALMLDRMSVQGLFILKLLLVLALANATHPADQVMLPSAKAYQWINFGYSALSRLESRDITLDTLRSLALLSLAEQIFEADTSSAALHSSMLVRPAMALGIHRIEDRLGFNHESQRCLWEAIVDLDVNACLGAGFPPVSLTASRTVPSNQHGVSNPETVPLILSKSLPIRHKIVTILNRENKVTYPQVIHLSGELTKIMAAVSNPPACDQQNRDSFEWQYLSWIYTRFLAALHRPFTLLSNPAFHLCSSTIARLSRIYLVDLITASQRQVVSQGSFTPLLSAKGAMFRLEATHAVLMLCHGLYKDVNDIQSGVQYSSLTNGGTAVQDTLRELIPIMERNVNANAGIWPKCCFLVPKMVRAHLEARQRFKEDYVGYGATMEEAGIRALQLPVPGWREIAPSSFVSPGRQ